MQDSRGRLMALMTHNTDVADTWEREGKNRDCFNLFSPRGCAIGANVVVYALTHQRFHSRLTRKPRADA